MRVHVFSINNLWDIVFLFWRILKSIYGIHEILKDRKYENIMDNKLYHLSLLLEEYNALEKVILSIIEASKGSGT